MITVAILAIVAGMFYCMAMSILGWMSWQDKKDWHFLAGTILYGITSILLAVWLLRSCA